MTLRAEFSTVIFIGARMSNDRRLLTIREGRGDLLHSCYIDEDVANQLFASAEAVCESVKRCRSAGVGH